MACPLVKNERAATPINIIIKTDCGGLKEPGHAATAPRQVDQSVEQASATDRLVDGHPGTDLVVPQGMLDVRHDDD